MKQSIFITGIAGSGKSTIAKELNILRYESYDIEDDQYGLFTMIKKDTGERYTDYDNSGITKVNNLLWVCDLGKLKALIDRQKKDVAFYCGTASDCEKLIPLFDKSILLQVRPEVLNNRLLVREGTNNFANTEAGRQVVLSWKDDFEDKMIKAGMFALDANASPKQVAEDILNLIEH